MKLINEKRLREMVRNVIKEELNNEDFKINISDFWELNSLTKEQLMQLSLDFRLFLSFPDFNDNLYYDDEQDKITLYEQAENVTKSYSQVKNYLMRRLGMQDWMIQQTKGCNGFRLIILVSNIGVNPKILVKVMENLGWFNSRISPPKRVNGITIECMSFDPMYQKPLTNDIRSRWNWLYHISPIENKESILQKGLIPSSKNKIFKYPNRIYLLKPSITQKEMETATNKLWCANGKPNNGIYTVFKIILKKVPNEVEFYNDPRFSKGVFCNNAIPNKAIVAIGEIDAKGLPN